MDDCEEQETAPGGWVITWQIARVELVLAEHGLPGHFTVASSNIRNNTIGKLLILEVQFFWRLRSLTESLRDKAGYVHVRGLTGINRSSISSVGWEGWPLKPLTWSLPLACSFNRMGLWETLLRCDKIRVCS